MNAADTSGSKLYKYNCDPGMARVNLASGSNDCLGWPGHGSVGLLVRRSSAQLHLGPRDACGPQERRTLHLVGPEQRP